MGRTDTPALRRISHPSAANMFKLVAQSTAAQAAGTTQSIAFDIGTGTGVLAAVHGALRGVQRIAATDLDPRALQCARDNLTRLNLIASRRVSCKPICSTGRSSRVDRMQSPMASRTTQLTTGTCHFRPGKPHAARISARFARSSAAGWRRLADSVRFCRTFGIAHACEELLHMIDAAGLKVLGRTDIKPHHPRVSDTSDPLHSRSRGGTHVTYGA
jgi:hypothetical protein